MIYVKCDNCGLEEPRDGQFARGWRQVKDTCDAPTKHLCSWKCVVEYAQRAAGVLVGGISL